MTEAREEAAWLQSAIPNGVRKHVEAEGKGDEYEKTGRLDRNAFPGEQSERHHRQTHDGDCVDFRLKQHGSAHYTVESCGHMMVATLEAGKNLHISVIVVNIGQEATAGSTFIRLSSSGTAPPIDTATRVLASTGTVKLASLRSDLAHDH